MKDEALKLALEALKLYGSEHAKRLGLEGAYDEEKTKGDFAIIAIKQALAAPDLQAELDATNRQVEILSDALAESRREIDAMIAITRADEREACADIADRLPRIYRETAEAHYRLSPEPFKPSQFGFDYAELRQAESITYAIRARGNT
jgi:hypothetical protein